MVLGAWESPEFNRRVSWVQRGASLSDARLLGLGRFGRARMVRHQEGRACDGHDFVAAGALRVHPTARNALQVGEPDLAVRAGAERCVHGWFPKRARD